MRVALETNALYVSDAGVARYIRGLIQGFDRTAHPDVEIFPLAWPVTNFAYGQPRRALKTVYRELAWSRLHAPRLLQESHARVLHSTSEPLIRPPKGVKEVVTLHDLAILRHPQRFRRWHREAGKRRLRRLHDSDRVICVSRFTADEAIELLGLPAAKISVIHNGCPFEPHELPSETEPEFRAPADFFLFVGSLEPGKNLRLLKETYDVAETNRQALPPLLIVGARWEGVMREGAPPPNWHYLGRQSDEVLVYLYRRALALLFPSKYEGFGFPLIEAMALGCPVICSPVASLPEIGGAAAVFTDMTAAAYLGAMHRVGHEPSWRAEVIGKGFEQAARFSWRKCATEVVEIYRSVCQDS